jgi:hypothetical protein
VIQIFLVILLFVIGLILGRFYFFKKLKNIGFNFMNTNTTKYDGTIRYIKLIDIKGYCLFLELGRKR